MSDHTAVEFHYQLLLQGGCKREFFLYPRIFQQKSYPDKKEKDIKCRGADGNIIEISFWGRTEEEEGEDEGVFIKDFVWM